MATPRETVRRISMWLSIAIGAVLMVHLAYPPFAIDTGSLGLLAILIVVFVLPYSKAIHFPGGGGIELALPAMEKAVEKAEAHPAPRVYTETLTDSVAVGEDLKTTRVSGEERAWRLYVSRDPNVGLAGLRMEIERLLRQLVRRSGIDDSDKRRTIGHLMGLLEEKELLSSAEVDAVNEVVQICNQAVHGAEVSPAAAEIVAQFGDRVIALLKSKLG